MESETKGAFCYELLSCQIRKCPRIKSESSGAAKFDQAEWNIMAIIGSEQEQNDVSAKSFKEIAADDEPSRSGTRDADQTANAKEDGDGSAVNPELMEFTAVAKAVDDGVIEVAVTDWKDSVRESSNVHRIGDAIRRSGTSVSKQLYTLGESVKSSASHVSQDIKTKAAKVGGDIKTGVETLHGKVKANPYPYALGAIGLGFILGRLVLGKKTAKAYYPAGRDYQSDPTVHTGVHV